MAIIDLGKGRDLTGKRFGSLVAVRPIRKNDNHQWVWEFKCDCGGRIVQTAAKVKYRGEAASCCCCAFAPVGLAPIVVDGKRGCPVCGDALPDNAPNRMRYHDGECTRKARNALYRLNYSVNTAKKNNSGSHIRHGEAVKYTQDCDGAIKERRENNDKFWEWCNSYNDERKKLGKKTIISYQSLVSLNRKYNEIGKPLNWFAANY